MLIAQGVPDGDDRLTQLQVRRGPDDRNRERAGSVDLDDRQVVDGVDIDNRSVVAGAVVQGGPQGFHAGDHVVVGQDVAPFIDDHSRSHPVELAIASRFEGRVADQLRPLTVDVHHRGLGAFDRLDHRGLAEI